jgi:hypothetical protein
MQTLRSLVTVSWAALDLCKAPCINPGFRRPGPWLTNFVNLEVEQPKVSSTVQLGGETHAYKNHAVPAVDFKPIREDKSRISIVGPNDIHTGERASKVLLGNEAAPFPRSMEGPFSTLDAFNKPLLEPNRNLGAQNSGAQGQFPVAILSVR